METLFIGQNAVHLTAVGSTNSYASEMLRQIRPAEGTIVYTFEQTSGRGQRGNTWMSEPNKNVALSLVLYPSFLPANGQFLLTKMASLAVYDLMAEMLPAKAREIRIKWPNDIYAGGKKIAGILIENTLSDQQIQNSVTGIGINVNQADFGDLNAVSLSLLSGQEHDLQGIITRLCSHLEARYLQLRAGKTELLGHQYLQQLYRLDEWKKYSTGTEIFEGRIRSVSETGKLQIELQDAGLREFDLKEIAFI
jgi:BirA family biotin operon repressor/biotin-[acetyl-CoA-carboxylase] ligase